MGWFTIALVTQLYRLYVWLLRNSYAYTAGDCVPIVGTDTCIPVVVPQCARPLTPQSGMLDAMRRVFPDLSTSVQDILNNQYLTFDKKSELMILHFLELPLLNTKSQYALWVTRLCAHVSDKSILELAQRYLNSDKEELYPQLDSTRPPTKFGTFRTMFLNAHENWEQFNNSEGFDKFMTAFSIAIGIGLQCDENSIFKTSADRLEMFAKFIPRKTSWCGLTEALFDVTAFFLKTWPSFVETGLLVDLIHKNSPSQELDARILAFESEMSDCRDGNLQDMLFDCEELIVDLEKLKLSVGEHWLQNVIHNRLSSLHTHKNKLKTRLKSSSHHRRPFAISFSGGSGVGKSGIMKAVMSMLSFYHEWGIRPENISNVNSADPYDSTITSYSKIAILDDVMNSAMAKDDEGLRVIRFINDVAYVTNQASLEDKGAIIAMFLLVLLSTNVEDLGVRKVTNNPMSRLGRLVHVNTMARKEFQNAQGGLDAILVLKAKEEAKATGKPMPSEYIFNIKHPVYDKHAGQVLLKIRPPVVVDGVSFACEDMDLVDFLRVILQLSDEHNARQDASENSTEYHKLLWESPCINPDCKKGFLCVEHNGAKLCYPTGPASTQPKEVKDKAVLEGIVSTLPEDATIPVVPPEPLPSAASAKIQDVLDGTDSLFLMETVVPPVSKDPPFKTLEETMSPEVGRPVTFFELFFFYLGAGATYIGITLVKALYYETIDIAESTLFVFLRQLASVCIRTKWFHLLNYVPFLPNRERYVRMGLYIHCRGYVCFLFMKIVLLLFTPFVYIWAVHEYLPFKYYYCAGFCLIAQWYQAHDTFKNFFVLVSMRLQEEPSFFRMVNDALTPTTRDVMKYTVFGLSFGTAIAIVGALRFAVRAQGGITSMTREKDDEIMVVKEPMLSPKTPEQLVKRDEKRWRPYAYFHSPTSTKGSSTTNEQFMRIVQKNVVKLVGPTFNCFGVMLCTNVCAVPGHIWRKDIDKPGLLDTLSFRVIDGVSLSKPVNLSKDTVHFSESDWCLVYFNIGSYKDITEYLTDDSVSSSVGMFHLPTIESDKREFDATGVQIVPAKVVHLGNAVELASYVLKKKTFPGACGAPLVSARSTLIGFHVCGSDSRPFGCAVPLVKEEVITAITHLRDLNAAVMVAHSAMPLDIKISEPHYKSPINHIDPEPSVRYLGSTPKYMSKFVPYVAKTPLYENIQAVFKHGVDWGSAGKKGEDGKPMFPYTVALNGFSHGGTAPHGGLIARAVKDYLSPIDSVKAATPELFMQSPLTIPEIINGQDGVAFVDRMKMSTSAHPYPGKKSDLFIPVMDGDVVTEYTMPPEVFEEYTRVGELMLEGVRPGFLNKACLKEEPTETTKFKQRVFICGDLTLLLWGRKLFLPVARLLMSHPLLFECAVGISHVSTQWTELANHLSEFGNQKIVEGDYKAYDQRLPAGIVEAAFSVLIDIASKLDGYTEDDIKIMRVIAEEVIYARVAWNGDIVELLAGVISGFFLTALVNSISNSLLLRCFFYSRGEHTFSPFRTHVKAITFGDDVGAHVDDTVATWFTFQGYQKFLAEHDIGFTPADKDDENPAPHVSIDEFSFLKRKFRRDKERKLYASPIEVNSVYRMLSCVTISSESVLDVTCTNIDTSLREMFQYGRVEYETFRLKLLSAIGLVEDAATRHMLSAPQCLYRPYDVWIPIIDGVDEEN